MNITNMYEGGMDFDAIKFGFLYMLILTTFLVAVCAPETEEQARDSKHYVHPDRIQNAKT